MAKGDQFYFNNFAESTALSKEGANPLHVIAWRDIYRCLEACADACEHVSECVGSVIMKNT